MNRIAWKRVVSGMLAIVLVLSNVPATALATDDATGLCTHHEVHTDCGYEEGVSDCGYECDICNAEPEPTAAETQAPSEPEPTVAETEAPTEPEATEEPTEPEATEEPTEPEATEEPTEPVCTGLADCDAENHNDDCQKKLADEKAAADKTAADAVAAQIDALPSLDEVKAKPMEEQGADYNQIQAAYTTYEKLTADQKALLPPAEEVFKPYFDYFNSLTQETDIVVFGTCGDNLTWTLDEEGTLTISGTGEMTSAPWGVSYREAIKTVSIQEGVSSLVSCAFSACDNLTNISIPSSVTHISYYAFSSCSSLTNVTLPDTLTSIGPSAFEGCYRLESISIPDSVTTIGDGAFSGCDNLKAISLPVNVTNIGVAAFSYCRSLTSISIPKAVMSIGSAAFEYCDMLTGIWVDEKNPNYSSDSCGVLFNKDKTLLIKAPVKLPNDYIIPASVTRIGVLAFSQCTNLTTIVTPASVTSIDDYAFVECKNLVSITIPGNIDNIALYAFYDCTSLTDITISDSIRTIGYYAFNGCNSLTDIYYGGTESQWNTITIDHNNEPLARATIHFEYSCANGHDFKEVVDSKYLKTAATYTEPAVYYKSCACGEKGTETFKYGEVLEPDYGEDYLFTSDNAIDVLIAFEGFSKYPVLVDGQWTIGHGTVISTEEFETYNENGITQAEARDLLKKDLTEVVDKAINNFATDNNLTLTQHQHDALAVFSYNYGCLWMTDSSSDFRTAILQNKTGNEFIDTIAHCQGNTSGEYSTGIIRRRLCEANMYLNNVYSSAWPDKYDYVRLDGDGDGEYEKFQAYDINSPTAIYYTPVKAGYTFLGWANTIDTSTIVSQLDATTAGSNLCAIWNTCGEHLTWHFDAETGKLTISGTGAMNDYDSSKETPWYGYRSDIKTVEIKDGVTRLGNYAFSWCESLTAVKVPESVKNFGDNAFNGCTNLTTINIPDGVTHISKELFAECGRLAGVKIPDGVTSIGFGAFVGCELLTEINLPDGLKSIGDCAFYSCHGLTSVAIPASLTFMGGEAFLDCPITDVYISDLAAWLNLTHESDEEHFAEFGFRPYGKNLYLDGELLTDVVIPNGVTKIGESAFSGYEHIRSVKIPDSVTEIDWFAFCGCKNLTYVDIPASVSTINTHAFNDIEHLRIIIRNPNVNINGKWDGTDLGDPNTTIIFGLEGSTAETYAKANGYKFSTLDGKCGDNLTWKFDDETGTLTISGTGEMTNYSEPSLDNIPWAPFASRVQKLVVEPGVTSIGEWAFIKCLNIKELILPNSLKTIGGYSFYGNEGIEELVFPEGLKHIGEAAFEFSTNLKKIVIPESLESSGYAPFWCTNPEIVVAGNLTPGLFAYCHYYRVTLGDNITTIPEQTFVDGRLGEIVIPASVKVIEKQAFYLCGKGNKIIFQGNAPEIAENAFEETSATIYYPAGNETWTEEVRQNYGGTITWMAEGLDGNDITMDHDEWADVSTVWVNGVAYPVVTENGQTKVQIPDGVTVEEGTSMVTYNFHVGDTNDVHTQYPTGMQVWILQENELGELIPTRIEELDDILQYAGSSIRITGKQGIRMITSIQQSKKNALVTAGLADYKLLEYGTALCWASDLNGGTALTLDQSYVKSNYAYKRDVADPVFKYAGNLMQYTNVLVGFTLDQCKDDIAMRPYMILEGPNGEQVTIYGGIVYRSIGYIAYQNRNAFTPGSDAYEFVWNIIHHVYGNKYDADYKG